MTYETIQLTKKEGNATIALNRPDVHNAMNEQLMTELTTCFTNLGKDAAVRTIVLTGNGPSFCAGADLNWMKSMVSYSKQENIHDSNLLLTLFNTIYYCPKPVIGKINGHAFGGGIGLIASCDITLGVLDAKFAFSEVNLGIIPAVISTFVARRVNLASMRRLFITGERFTTEYAHQIGLIDFLVPEDKINEKIEFYIKILSSSGPNAIAEIKNLLKYYETHLIENYQDFSVEKIAELRISKEGQEGINAFLEKRKPTWRN